MFENRFNSKKTDPLVEAVKQAQADGELRRQAEALVNEEFGVYSRKAVVREQLAAYDARLEEAYKCMKEGQKLADKDYDKDGKIESPKDEVWGSRFRAAKMAGKMEEEQIDEISTEKLIRYRNKAGEGREKGAKLAYAKLTGKAKVPATMPKHSYMEEEQIDEISKELTRRYKDKAHASYTYSAGKRSDDEFVSGPGKKMTDASGNPKFKERSKEAQKADDKTIQKRLKGLGMAHKRLSKEETQIDEISRHTLMSYRNKAAKQVMDIKKKGWSTEKDRDTVQKREIGHSLAGDKMRVRVAASYNKGYSPEDLAKHGGRGGATPRKVDEEQIDEVSAGLAQRAAHRAFVKSDKMKADAKKEPDMHSYVQAVHKGEKKSKQGTKFAKYAAKKMEEESIDEAAYSAKAARAGKDIGKPGKMFSKIAKKAGERYGSEERGKKVAGAILKRIRAKHMREEQIDELSAFGKEYAAHRGLGQGATYRSKVTGQMIKIQDKVPGAKSSTSKGPQDNPGLKGATGFPRTMKTDVGNIKVSPSTPGSGYSQSAERMKAMKPETTPTTPGSMKISSQPAPTSGPSGQEKMDAMKNLKPDAPTSTPAPSMSMLDPKAKALKESVQVGDYKYRIV